MQAGDALYVPEGWWHQVWSEGGGTFAINFWWESAVSSAFGGDMDRWMTVTCIVSVEGSECSSLECACRCLACIHLNLGMMLVMLLALTSAFFLLQLLFPSLGPNSGGARAPADACAFQRCLGA
jgi:hypothetical protein